MKKKVIIEQSFCDICGKEASGYQSCAVCGKEFCYECVKVEAVEYKHGVYFSGSGDGLYCLQCDSDASKNGDTLHLAYRKIQALKHESIGIGKDFDLRRTEAEAILKKLLDKQKALKGEKP